MPEPFLDGSLIAGGTGEDFTPDLYNVLRLWRPDPEHSGVNQVNTFHIFPLSFERDQEGGRQPPNSEGQRSRGADPKIEVEALPYSEGPKRY